MSSKLNKKERMLLHKLAVLHTLSMSCMDDLNAAENLKEHHKKAFEPAMKVIEGFLDNISENAAEPQKTTSYLFELSQKVDTVIRKNYKPI